MQRVFTHLAACVTIKKSTIVGGGTGVFTRNRSFEVDEIMIAYGDQEYSEAEWKKITKQCYICQGDPKKLFECNECNRMMTKTRGLVSRSTPFDLSGYINHSSDPAKINFEKVSTIINFLLD